MSYSIEFKEVLQEYDGALYKMILLKIKSDDQKFEHMAEPNIIVADDGTLQAYSFMNDISGNQRELIGYFTTDAFVGFGSSVTLRFIHNFEVYGEITGFDVGTLEPLPSFYSSYTYTDADNNWLANL